MTDTTVTDDQLLEAARFHGIQTTPPPAMDNVSNDALISAAAYHGIDVAPPSMNAEPSLMSQGINLASHAVDTVKNAATGDGRIEYPDMPEITDADIGFMESFVPNLKLGLTTDAHEKANIIQSHFKDDQRFGGIFQDKHGNPIVKWGEQSFYVNKPGFSEQDTNDLVAQGVQLLPAAKVAGGAASMGGRLLAGIPLYGATNVAQQYGTMAVGGKDAVDPMQAGEAGIVGGIAEAVTPPLFKAAVKPFKSVFNSVKPGVTTSPPQSGSIPYTRGQEAGDFQMLKREEAMRQGGYGDGAQGTMRTFDDHQLGAIRSEADGIQADIGSGSGFGGEDLSDIGQNLQSGLMQARDSAKRGVDSAYRAAGESDLRFWVSSLGNLSKGVRESLRGMPITEELTPATVRALKEIGNLSQLPKKVPGRITSISLQRLETVRRTLGEYIGAAKNPTDKRGATRIKAELNSWLDDAVDYAVMTGDPEALVSLRKAIGLRAEFAERFGANKTVSGAKDPGGVAMTKILDELQATPEQVINYLTGGARITSTARSVGLVRRIADIFGPDSQEVGLMKDAFLVKAFTTVRSGQRDVSRASIVSNARNFLFNNTSLANAIFTNPERQRLNAFVQDVARTMTPEDTRNPSRSAWAVFQLLQDHNLLTASGKALKYVPFGSEVGRAMEAAGGAVSARNATSGLDRLLSVPLVSAGATAAALKARRGMEK